MDIDDAQSIGGVRKERADKDDWTSDSDIKNQNDGYIDGKPDDENERESERVIEKALSQSLMKLSIGDRNEIYEEIHGVRCLAVEETPELIQRSLREFQKKLDRHNDRNSVGNHNKISTKAYNLIWKRREQETTRRFSSATRSSRDGNHRCSYNYAMDDDDFRLRFLRCELFDVEKAVSRFLNYLDFVYDHWGKIALERPIRLADLTKADLHLLRKGLLQFLPFRDSSGRRVLLIMGGMEPFVLHKRLDKLIFYLIDVATGDSIESQRRGVVLIRMIIELDEKDGEAFDSGRSKITNRVIFRTSQFHRAFSSIPSRIVAMHIRVPYHPISKVILKLVIINTLSGRNAFLRQRIIPHYDLSDLQIRYRLKSYGIPTQLLPLTDTNSIKYTYFNQWVKTRKVLDDRKFGMVDHNDTSGAQAFDKDGCTTSIKNNSDSHESSGINAAFITTGVSATDSIVDCPALNDVVFRKGSRVTSIVNPGNRFFCELIRTFLEEKQRALEQLRREEPIVEDGGREQWGKTDRAPPTGSGDSLGAGKPNPTAYVTAAVAPLAPPPLYPGARTATAKAEGKKITSKGFCVWLVNYLEKERKGRFLEWNNQIGGWIVMRDKNQILRKVSVTLYNWGKRINAGIAAKKQQEQQVHSNSAATVSAVWDGSTEGDVFSASYGFLYDSETNSNANASMVHTNDHGSFYGGNCNFLSIQQVQCSIMSSAWNDFTFARQHQDSPTSGQKRPRTDSLFFSEG